MNQKLREPVHHHLHQPLPFFATGTVRIATAGVGCQQVPGATDADPTAVDGIEPTASHRTLIGRDPAVGLLADQMVKEGESERSFRCTGMVAGIIEQFGLDIRAQAAKPVTKE